MARMRIAFVLALLGAAAAGDIDFAKEAYEVEELGFEIDVPEGWKANHDRFGMVALAPDGKMGFRVSREPMLPLPDRFKETWQQELRQAHITTEVEEDKAYKYDAWRARWPGGANKELLLEAWRIHVEDTEMLFNVSFSAPKGAEEQLDDLVKGVTRSFRAKERRVKLKLQKRAIRIGHAAVRLPEGYEKPPPARFRRPSNAYKKTIKGYTPPHESGHFEMRIVPASGRTMIAREVVRIADDEDMVAALWKQTRQGLGEVFDDERTKAARVARAKGSLLSAGAFDKKGNPKRYFVFVGKKDRQMLIVELLIDERDARLYDDVFDDICDTIDLP